MLDTFKSLPEDPDELRAISVQMAQHIQSQAYQIEKLKAELHGHRKARFGSKSEAMDQLALNLADGTQYEELGLLLAAESADYLMGDAALASRRYITFLESFESSVYHDEVRLRFRELNPDATQ